MKMLKKLLLLFVAAGMMFTSVQAREAQKFSDIDSNYWAYTEIAAVVNDGVMAAKDGAFNPEAPVARVCFVSSLLKVLGHDETAVTVKNPFSDVAADTKGYEDILKSQQLGLVYGYPNGKFLPEKTMTKAEVTSVMSHITKDATPSANILNQFTDKAEIPAWDVAQYAKAVTLGLYVNYPDAAQLEPNREITRAEAAVLLYRLKNALNLVKDQYKASGVEHLNVSKKAETNEVIIADGQKIIKKGNLLEVEFDELFKSKNANEGDIVAFKFDKDVYTKEGTLAIPAGTKVYGQVTEIIPTKWFNKNARVSVLFNKAVLPCGTEVAMNAIPFTKDNYLKEGPWETTGKLTAYTLGGAVVGGGVGTAIGVPSEDHKYLNEGLGIGIPVGAGVGLAAGLITKGLNYVGHEGDKVLLYLLEDVVIPQ